MSLEISMSELDHHHPNEPRLVSTPNITSQSTCNTTRPRSLSNMLILYKPNLIPICARLHSNIYIYIYIHNLYIYIYITSIYTYTYISVNYEIDTLCGSPPVFLSHIRTWIIGFVQRLGYLWIQWYHHCPPLDGQPVETPIIYGFYTTFFWITGFHNIWKIAHHFLQATMLDDWFHKSVGEITIQSILVDVLEQFFPIYWE